jgi:hypothetical protein
MRKVFFSEMTMMMMTLIMMTLMILVSLTVIIMRKIGTVIVIMLLSQRKK